MSLFNSSHVSGALSATLGGAPGIAERGFPSEPGRRLRHSLLRAVRPPIRDRTTNTRDFFVRLRIVKRARPGGVRRGIFRARGGGIAGLGEQVAPLAMLARDFGRFCGGQKKAPGPLFLFRVRLYVCV